MPNIKLKKLDGFYTISQLSVGSAIPDWCDGEGFVNISRGDDELSIICLNERVPEGVKSDGEWTCFKFMGPFAFGETGIVLSVVKPVSENGIGILIASTFNGDYLLVQNSDLTSSIEYLKAAGHTIL
ncbi:ACT domain-containing protein [Brucella tritici]|uniref:ACT domain-containing protein n=1 Tax=Brucella tritici TaxID=94626 RepID=UPI00124E5860|nr:ACT domain-containing protein [Brucella tritici]KAB2668023.1 ACT domain-containing protein [Brucella tritici]